MGRARTDRETPIRNARGSVDCSSFTTDYDGFDLHARTIERRSRLRPHSRERSFRGGCCIQIRSTPASRVWTQCTLACSRFCPHLSESRAWAVEWATSAPCYGSETRCRSKESGRAPRGSSGGSSMGDQLRTAEQATRRSDSCCWVTNWTIGVLRRKPARAEHAQDSPQSVELTPEAVDRRSSARRREAPRAYATPRALRRHFRRLMLAPTSIVTFVNACTAVLLLGLNAFVNPRIVPPGRDRRDSDAVDVVPRLIGVVGASRYRSPTALGRDTC